MNRSPTSAAAIVRHDRPEKSRVVGISLICKLPNPTTSTADVINIAERRRDVGSNRRTFLERERTADVHEIADFNDRRIGARGDPLVAVEVDVDRIGARARCDFEARRSARLRVCREARREVDDRIVLRVARIDVDVELAERQIELIEPNNRDLIRIGLERGELRARNRSRRTGGSAQQRKSKVEFINHEALRSSVDRIRSIEHEVAIRGEVLALLADQSEADMVGIANRRKLQEMFKDTINKVLTERAGFGGIESVFITALVMQ